jgi:hypothetical protein
MKFDKTINIKLSEEEKESLTQVITILTNFEIDTDKNCIDELQEEYEKSLGYFPHNTALPTAIDYLQLLLDLSIVSEEEEE